MGQHDSMAPNQWGVLLLPFGLRREGISDFHIAMGKPQKCPDRKVGVMSSISYRRKRVDPAGILPKLYQADC